ncbi:hypothetical protein [Qipengyuania sphaerica]|uniref:hypothetical protein n=1 Tax=Qipengyuania sphaerica TaxID=2867243 RepID=UPI001C88CD50|nr:hypothetical protein [Qipengyuania sphaerica]MBX7541299.1 hypothetical protein [Qipengyuania sphaerica]
MIRMRQQGDRFLAVPPRRYARFIVLALTLLAIALFSWSMRPVSSAGAVMRVALDRVPEERVVEFGHENAPIRMIMPVPAEEVPPGAASDPRSSGGMRETERDRPRLAKAASPARMVKPDKHGILPIGYSLPEGVSSQAGGVGVSKTLASEQGAATGLTIFLIGGSLIEVDRGELVAALAQLGAAEKASSLPPASESGRLSLDRVRTAGLDLRYDAIQDRLVLRP